MKNRSRVHMLSVAAARLEQDGVSPELVKDLRREANRLAEKRASGADYTSEDDRRIERQRNLMTMLPDIRSAEALKEGMMQRAYDLLWDGDGSACDALLEFLPSAAAEKVLNAWDNDQDGKQPRSEFYSR